MRFRNRKSSYDSGLFAEWRARWFLRFHGFKILKSRYITGKNTNRAEIDLIAQRGNLIIFCEVKKRDTIQNASDAITSPQAARLRAAAETYLAQRAWVGDARFDAILICKSGLHWIQNAL